MADQDTDRWIFEVNAPDIRRKMEDLEKQVQWTDLVYEYIASRSTTSALTALKSAIVARRL